MKKSELKNGAIVECRNGKRFIKIDNTLLNKDGGYISLDDYSEYLYYVWGIEGENKAWDIVKANNEVGDDLCYQALFDVVHCDKWTWKRKKGHVLTNKEKEYLSAVIKPFKDNIKYIHKSVNLKCEYCIIITFKDNVVFRLPYFSGDDNLYTNMIFGIYYTLADLGLE